MINLVSFVSLAESTLSCPTSSGSNNVLSPVLLIVTLAETKSPSLHGSLCNEDKVTPIVPSLV
ncbi:hypothetical protein D3C78_1784080 [compost metagenome]